MAELSPTIELSNLQVLLVETVANEIVAKLTKEDIRLSNEHIIAYLCSLVLDAIKDHKITPAERVSIVTNIICVVINQLPLPEHIKRVLYSFINDGEIQELLEEYEAHVSQKCVGCFGKVFRACLRSKQK